jgi:hypothetical protein
MTQRAIATPMPVPVSLSVPDDELKAQRRDAWQLLEGMTRADGSAEVPRFESWQGEAAVFAPRSHTGLSGIRGFARRGPEQASSSPGVPVINYTLYNAVAVAHLRAHRLEHRAELARLRRTGVRDRVFTADRSIAGFPDGAVILKTAWWPLAADRITALPVWDPESNPARAAGNSYLSWQRVVGVVPPGPLWATTADATIDFAGRRFPEAHRLRAGELHTLRVDQRLAARLMRDPPTREAAVIALGRALAAGDYLALVSLNVASHAQGRWQWAAFWWHDRPDSGPDAADRPASLPEPWRHFLLQVTIDSDQPPAADGGPAVCFDPWLEGRFPDGGQGSGVQSNCIACHRRASFPPIAFLPVTRGAADAARDPAFAPGRLRTDFIWSIALHAEP